MVAITILRRVDQGKMSGVSFSVPGVLPITFTLKAHFMDPLHGKTLEAILTFLVDRYGWPTLANQININCFKSNPSIKSSLTFLRKTEWARKKVEELYVKTIGV